MGSPLSPVTEGVYALVQDLVVAGGIHEDRPQDAVLPAVWLEVQEARDERGFGTGSLPQIFVRTHVFSQAAGRKEAEDLDGAIVDRLKDRAVTITGFQQCGLMFWDDTIAIPDAELNGVKVHEIVSFYRVYAEAP